MELNNAFINSELAQKTLDYLLQQPLHPKVGYTLAKIKNACVKQSKNFFPKYISTVAKYAYLKEDGTFDPRNGEHTYTIKPEHEEEWKKVNLELLTEKFEVPKSRKLSIDDLGDIKLEPVALAAIEQILDLDVE